MAQPDWRSIEREVSGLVVSSVSPLGEGWSGRVYLVNGDLVFKFPKRSSDWEPLEREGAFLSFAKPYLPLGVPEHICQIRDSMAAPCGYLVYRYIPGTRLVVRRLKPENRASVVASLARFLRDLHNLTPGKLPLCLPHEPARTASLEYLAAAERFRIRKGLSAHEISVLNNTFARYLEDPANLAYQPKVIHADLSSRHVLHVGHTVTGILDFGDVCLGDVDYDFGCIFSDLGEEFVRNVAVAYSHPDVERLVSKARYFAIVDQIDTIEFGQGRAPRGAVGRAWTRLRTLLRQVTAAPSN